jgi:hypothetical protein
MKVDKEALKKNRFWIGLGGFVFVWLIGLIWALCSGNSSAKANWENAKRDVTQQLPNAKTAAWQEPWNAHGSLFRKKKDTAWELAWNMQQRIYNWPEGMPAKLLFPDDTWGPDQETDQNARSEYRNTFYTNQYKELKNRELVKPVQFLDGFEAVFPPQPWNDRRAPTREECWLAQEDFWVRKEMLLCVRDALNAVARMEEDTGVKEVAPKEGAPKDAARHSRWHNSNWELDLVLEPGGRVISGKSKIKNLSEKTLLLADPRTSRGIFFRVFPAKFGRDGKPVLENGKMVPDLEAPYYRLEVAGEPLAPGRDTDFKEDTRVDTFNFGRPFFVYQEFTWDTSPIRRLDLLALGKHSHRTHTAGLKIRPDLKRLDEPQEEAKPGTAPGRPGTPGTASPGAASPAPTAMPGKGMPTAGASVGGPGAPGMTSGQQPEDVTKVNSIPRERYMHVTDQCRHLPIVLRVVLDESHIHELLAAVVNSRLRVQVTQIQLVQAEDVKYTPPTGSEASTPEAPGRPTAPGMPRTGPGSGGRKPPVGMPGPTTGRPTGMPRPGPGGPGMPSGYPGAEKGNLQPDNVPLMEVTIYGVASLYERFPPRDYKPTPPPATPTTSKTPGTPAGTPPGTPPGTPAGPPKGPGLEAPGAPKGPPPPGGAVPPAVPGK